MIKHDLIIGHITPSDVQNLLFPASGVSERAMPERRESQQMAHSVQSQAWERCAHQ